MKKLPISLIIIARNEEKNLPRCLNSAAPWVTEIVGVINRCTDKTKEILESYGAKVYEHEWEGFTNQKNNALKYALQPWVLSIDADEEISPYLARSIQEFIESKQDYNGAYWARKTWFLGRWIKHGDWYPDHVLKLFKREKGRFCGGRIHETVIVDGAVKKLKGNLLHYSFNSIDHMSKKFLSYAEAFLNDKLEKGHNQFSITKTILRAFWRFFRCYFVRLGFLDGYPGFYIAVNQSFYTLFRYTQLYENKQKNIKTEIEACDR